MNRPDPKTPEEVKKSLAYRMKCTKCGHIWRHQSMMPTCPECKCVYVHWTTFTPDMTRIGRR